MTTEQEVKPKRPISVSILAVLFLIGGCIGGGLVAVPLVFKVFTDSKIQTSLSSIGFHPVLLVVAIVFVLALCVASGIGMWPGEGICREGQTL